MALLGHALARAAGVPGWPDLLRARVLDPLGMRSTVVVEGPGQVPAGTARPHHDNGWPAPVWSGPAFAPAGSSTVTTAADLARWAGALLDGSAPGAAALDPLVDIPGGPDRPGLARPRGRRPDRHLAQRRHRRQPDDPRAGPRARSGRAAADEQRPRPRRRGAAPGGRGARARRCRRSPAGTWGSPACSGGTSSACSCSARRCCAGGRRVRLGAGRRGARGRRPVCWSSSCTGRGSSCRPRCGAGSRSPSGSSA